jgi:hypothetical protein
MKINRDGNKITLEVEESDCDGQPMEVVADFIYEGMVVLTEPRLWAEATSNLLSVDMIRAKLEEATKRVAEKWEIVPPPAESQKGGS